MESEKFTPKEQRQLEIIRRVMRERGIKQDVIAEALGLERSGVSKLLNGRRQMKAREMIKIGRVLGLDVASLLSGVELDDLEEFRDYSQIDWTGIDDDATEGLADEIEEYREHDRRNYRSVGLVNGSLISRTKLRGAIPEIDVLVGAGEGTIGEVVTLPIGEESYSGHPITAEWLIPETYTLHELHINRARSLVMKVVGDSMMPTYAPGDRVIVDLQQTAMTVDGVYVISDGDSPPQIKRLQRVLFSTPVEVDVVSDNQSHKIQRVEMERLRIIGRVAGRVSVA
jgi:transcriptional regulator with XRE-family HTH domain